MSPYLIERFFIPVIGAGAVWVMGRAEGHGKGFQAYVRCMAVFMFGMLFIFGWHVWIEKFYAGPIRYPVILWGAIVLGAIWYRHIK